METKYYNPEFIFIVNLIHVSLNYSIKYCNIYPPKRGNINCAVTLILTRFKLIIRASLKVEK